MTNTRSMRLGDYTGLAETYSKYRSDYASSVVAALLGLLGGPPSTLDAVDVGAGTGIWTRMLARQGFRSVIAVEPNQDMRRVGIRDSGSFDIIWREGRGEDTGLPSKSVDLLTMASSFHWTDFQAATKEFSRVLRPGGWFAAVWNRRLVKANRLLTDIEAELWRIDPNLRRTSSGPGGFTETLAERLLEHPSFTDVVVIEGWHKVTQPASQYLGAWKSVNDVRARLGEANFTRFLAYAEDRLADVESIEVTYRSQLWAARNVPATSGDEW
jgi:ubiquinone/menaquinone biosynthesis C-methylase UbiE